MSRETLLDQFSKLWRFAIVGGLAFIVDAGGMQALILSGVDPYLARAISLPLAMLAAYGMNRHYTFGASGRSQAEEMLRYVFVTAIASLTNYGVFAVLLIHVEGIWPLIAAALGLGVSMWVSFFGFQFFAFAARKRV
ncbi:MAG: GtrA family protein [Pseudomonadota bacterium]